MVDRNAGDARDLRGSCAMAIAIIAIMLGVLIMREMFRDEMIPETLGRRCRVFLECTRAIQTNAVRREMQPDLR